MKNLVLIAILVAGCSSTTSSAPDAATEKRIQKSQEITQSERQCIARAARNASEEMAQINAAGDSLTELRTRTATTQAKREVAACKAEADRLNEKVSSQERAEYQRQEDEERERSSLMMTITTSRLY
jgi:hypothetical protein